MTCQLVVHLNDGTRLYSMGEDSTAQEEIESFIEKMPFSPDATFMRMVAQNGNPLYIRASEILWIEILVDEMGDDDDS